MFVRLVACSTHASHLGVYHRGPTYQVDDKKGQALLSMALESGDQVFVEVSDGGEVVATEDTSIDTQSGSDPAIEDGTEVLTDPEGDPEGGADGDPEAVQEGASEGQEGAQSTVEGTKGGKNAAKGGKNKTITIGGKASEASASDADTITV